MRQLRYIYVLAPLLSLACATGQRNLRAHPAVAADPHQDFVVLVPFKKVASSTEAGSGAPVRMASLDAAAGVQSTRNSDSEPLTKLLNDFRDLEARSRYQETVENTAARTNLLQRIAKGYGTEVAVVRFRCTDIDRDDRSFRRLRRSDTVAQDRCAYISADLRDLLSIPSSAVQKNERNDVIAMLLNASDYNCSNFLVRAFAKKTNMDSSRNTLKDIGTGLATLVASPAPAISAGLGLTNLVAGSAVDNYNASFYLEKTFQVMESAIGKERATVRARIVENMKKEAPTDYSLYAALNDVRAYDDACSIERGLAVLSEMAAVQKDKAEVILNGALNPESEKARQLQALADQLSTIIRHSMNDRSLVDALTRERQAVEDALRRMTIAPPIDRAPLQPSTPESPATTAPPGGPQP